jgi:hypothetical protein
MSKLRDLALCIFVILSLSSCVTISPVNQSYEKAGTVGKGNIEAAGSLSLYSTSQIGLNTNPGLRIGYGVSENVDLKLRYEFIASKGNVVSSQGNTNKKADYFSIIPKFNLIKKKFSILTPFSIYNYDITLDGKNQKYVGYSFAPQLIATKTNAKNTNDISFSAKGDYMWNKQPGVEDAFNVGLNLGGGISKDLDKWAIRPEIGYMFRKAGEHNVFSYGIAYTYIFHRSSRK